LQLSTADCTGDIDGPVYTVAALGNAVIEFHGDRAIERQMRAKSGKNDEWIREEPLTLQ
jgi:hypothetical protein